MGRSLFLSSNKYFSPFVVNKVVLALTGGGVVKPATGVSSSKTGLYQNIGCQINLLDLYTYM